MAIGILAYGSLITDPGAAIKRRILASMSCDTPFKVEFARLSKKRGFAPTLVPVEEGGSRVGATIFVLNANVTVDDAKTLLWQREIGRNSDQRYTDPRDPENSPNRVLVRNLRNFQGVESVVYTDFPKSGKLSKPNGELLAKKAVMSAQNPSVEEGQDGISYLISAKAERIVTPLLPFYEREILVLTETASLEEAVAKSRNVLTTDEHEEAQRRAYSFALERGGGKLPPYSPYATTGDFWRAAGEVLAQRPEK